MVGVMKPFAERQKQLAKPFRPWSETMINLLNNMKIQLCPISTMVGSALTLVGDALTLVGDALTLVGDAFRLFGDTLPFAKRQKQLAKPFRPWSET
jgi:hypothetical protein